MLTERKFLDIKNMDKNYKSLLDQKTEERIFKIKSDFLEKYYYVMIIYGKVTTIKKIQGLDSFLSMSKGNNRIFIGNDINQKAFKQFLELKYSEVFFEYELLMNILEHELQPRFQILTEEEVEIKMKEYSITKKNMSKMFKTDPVARYYNAKVGTVFRIIRPSEFTGTGFHYRIVKDAPVSLLYA